MKNRILVLALLLIAFVVQAQGRRSGQSGIHAQYGYMPNSKDKDTVKGNSFMAIAGYNHVFGDKGFLGKAELFYMKNNVSYTGGQYLPYERYGLNVSAGYSYEGLYPLFLNLYGGAFAGYEKVNNGDERDPLYNALIPAKVKGFTYGLSGSAELELVLVRRLSLIANYTQFYDLQTKFSKSNYGIFGGLKYYIN